MATHLIWVRNDLRIHDNYALYAACRDPNARVMALYIATPEQWRSHDMSPKQAAFIYQSLQDLQRSLAEKAIPLHYLQRDDFSASIEALKNFCRDHNVDSLFYNYQHEVNERQRDAKAERELGEQGIVVQGFDDGLLPPGSVLTGSREMFKVFTPFSKAFLRRLHEGMPECAPAPERRTQPMAGSLPALTPFDYPQEDFNTDLFPVGEQTAIQRLRRFCQQPVAAYAAKRDMPAVDGTSRLSVYLVTGVLSPRQCLHRLLREHPDALENDNLLCWFNELIWREFYRHLIVAWPELCKHQPFISWTNRVQWQRNEEQLLAWQQGKTGYPIVDAAMRQLNSLGWMHNRLRMITASFLIKDLLIDWRIGERYFMSQLIDGDLAANNGGWQWAASSGNDAAPYFRIFNPTTQGERFDKEGEFIRRWLPELQAVPAREIHQPHEWARKNRVQLDYPPPIVDHKEARLRALAAYEAARK